MRFLVALACVLLLAGCGRVWNDPYPASESGKNILYSAFSERPKHLDPAQSYTADEYDFIWQIYEPPLQYHYLKRPYTLIPATAAAIPEPRYYNSAGVELPASARDVAYSVYEIHIKPGILYQPHPAFARDAAGHSLYLDLKPGDLSGKYRLADFPRSGSRELVAADYVYQIKRLAHPRINSPILGHMSDYIVGLKEYAALLQREDKSLPIWDSLARHEISGVELVDRYTYRIKVRGKYPQFVYWLAMPFFAPVPPEADRFYSQAGMAEKNLTLDWYPVGTGPYMLTENNPNARMVLARNPNFRGEPYPSEGEPGDAQAGLLADAGKTAPFIDTIVFTREKESIPYWNKFLQGYYDQSGISNDNFDSAVRMGMEGEAALSPEMARHGIRLKTSVATSVYYLSFNWLDPVVGGQGDAAQQERARKLRQAISIAIDNEEFISIFANGRGVPGQGPIPPGIFGYRGGEDGYNPVVYEKTGGAWHRRSIAQARKLLAEAGYPNGRDAAQRRAAGAVSGHHRGRAGRQGAAGLVSQAVAEDRRAARVPHQRLEPLPGEDPQGQYADVLPRLECRLSGSGKLHVPAVRAAGRGERGRREQGKLCQSGIRPPVRADEEHAERSRAPADHRSHGYPAAARRALGLGLLSQGLQPVSRLAIQREAEPDGAQRTQVLPSRPRSAGDEARRVEPTGVLAAAAVAGAAGAGDPARVSHLARARTGASVEQTMYAYIVRRVIYAVFILIGVNLITFALFFKVNTPDDIARMQLGVKYVTPEAIAKWKAERGYDKPLLYNAAAPGAKKFTDTIYFEKSVRNVPLQFRPSRTTGATSPTKSARACGPVWRWRCRCSWSALRCRSRLR